MSAPRSGRMAIPRSRGAMSGLLALVLGVWGAAAPFVGPAIGFAYGGGAQWTMARGWLQVLPGVVAVVGGVLLLATRHRAVGMLGGWLAVAAGAWFAVGRTVAGPLSLGDVGAPMADTAARRALLELAYFTGLGALLIFLGAIALGRLSIRAARDVERTARAADEAVPMPAVDEPPTARTEVLRRPHGTLVDR
jgi:hypothetical protein